MSLLTTANVAESAHSNKKGQLLASILLALVVLSIVGFAPLDVIHNAAHDTRHSSGFPCH